MPVIQNVLYMGQSIQAVGIVGGNIFLQNRSVSWKEITQKKKYIHSILKKKKRKEKYKREKKDIYIFGQQVTDTDIFCSAHGSML